MKVNSDLVQGICIGVCAACFLLSVYLLLT
jgi:MFS superfamily sulfate permease-like transporter